MRALGFVFLVACSFDPGAQGIGTDAAPGHDGAAIAVDAAGPVKADAMLPGPPMGSGSDCDVYGDGTHRLRWRRAPLRPTLIATVAARSLYRG